jgi:hypothetical protein
LCKKGRPNLVTKTALTIVSNERSGSNPAEECQWRTTDSTLHRKRLLIVDYFQAATVGIDSVPAHFVFNADEARYQEWDDRHERTRFVPVIHPGDQVCSPMSRTGKPIMLLASIPADSSYTTSLVIIPRKTIDDDFWLNGMTAEKVVIRSQSKGDIDIAIFEQ